MTCKGIKRGATVELTSSPYKQQLLEQQKVNTGTVNKAKYGSKRGKASKTSTIVTEEPDGNSTDYEEAQCLYCNDYILIQLKVKFGFSVPPARGGLTRSVQGLRGMILFVRSVLTKSL